MAGTKLPSRAWTDKEYKEQAFVTDFLIETLSEKGIKNLNLDGPITQPAGAIEHLKTNVSGECHAEMTPLEIAKAIHPTPAVGGLPYKKAIDFIEAEEKGDRRYYAGFFGPLNDTEAKLFVNLRCLEFVENGVILYAGAGITKESNPQNEWLETERKLETMAAVLY